MDEAVIGVNGQGTVRSQSGHSQVYSQVTVRSCKTQESCTHPFKRVTYFFLLSLRLVRDCWYLHDLTVT